MSLPLKCLIGGLTVLLAAGLAAFLLTPAPSLPPASGMLLAAAEGLDDIVIDASLEPESRTLHVKQRLTLTNRTGQKLDAAVLRTWPNAFQTLNTSPCAAEDDWYGRFYPNGFSAGSLVMARARVGQDVVYRYLDEARTVLSVPVPGGWAADSDIVIELEYAVILPRAAYRFGVWDEIWAVGNAFAVPAVWQDGAFRTDAYLPIGDPFLSECANYTVNVTLPDGYLCAASAYADRDRDGVYRFSAPAVRDFALVISKEYELVQAMEGGVLVNVFARSNAQEALRCARQAIACYEALWGEYPYQSFTLAETAFPVGGMEYPSLAMIGSDYLAQGGRELEYLIAHEAAHQWWYAVVGSDGWNQPWQDEALCEYGVLSYAERFYGASEKRDLEARGPQSAMRVSAPAGITPGSPISAFESIGQYKRLVYDRGAACLLALDELCGLDSFLRDYYTTYAFSIASREDFEAQLALSTGEDPVPLMRDYLDTHILN